MDLEKKYQRYLIDRIQKIYPNSFVLKNDPNYLQGVPDWIVLNGRNWAMLETKRHKNSPYQPNQLYYVEHLDAMSFARFVYPENENEVLRELQRSFSS